MSSIVKSLIRFVSFVAAVLAVFLGPVLLHAGGNSPEPHRQVTAQCYNGVIPLDPYIQSCTLPSNQSHVRGAAPDANAIIACRNHPGCLSWYVNNPR